MSSYPINTSVQPTPIQTTEVWTSSPDLRNLPPLPIYTNRLIIRELRKTDLHQYQTLLTDPGAIGGANIPSDLNGIRNMLPILPDEYELTLGIFLRRQDNQEGPLIGDGGLYYLRLDTEWPNLTYRIKQDHWNKGYATEFLNAYMRYWWSIPRQSEPKRLTIN